MSEGESTIYEVARRAAVSISTVSLAINHPDRVRSDTLDRILAVIDETGFVPKERAVARARAGVGRIAVIAPFTSYPAYARRLNGVFTELGRDGTQVIVYDHEDIAMASSPLLDAMPVKGHVDGIIIMDMPIDGRIVARLHQRLPAVVIGGAERALSRVDVDDFQGGRLVGERLAEWGHRRVAFVREAQVTLFAQSPTQQRFDGLASVLGRDSVLDVTVPHSEDAGRDAVRQLFTDPDRSTWPTAILATRDLVAIRVLRAAYESGIRVPENLSIVGYDDDPTAEAIGLTTIRNPLEETGAMAVRVLQRLMRGGPVEDVRLPVTLIERGTAGPVSASGHLAQDQAHLGSP